ncbi:MAG: DUF4044 domain-containing protein [Lactobacillus sp.]|nr:DUF4044 domain-containing protein [Bombilactobacillus bombi]MCO6542298.1 DUF4044 domain-containing protein [Lactobacillus sp.]MCO6542774.1 DUF4044 domain-containing protein [Lactobacillus sp.]
MKKKKSITTRIIQAVIWLMVIVTLVGVVASAFISFM